jgi:dTDP-4-dehydrorhamnose 3,5-epimerase-like enzyme
VNISIEKCPAFHDERGDLIQFVTDRLLQTNGVSFGQIYLLTFNGKNIVRGNHYHNHSSEIFCLISGSVEMHFVDVNSGEQMQKIFTANDNEFFRVAIGEKIAHAIKSISEFAVMVSFSSKEFDVNETDKIKYHLL